MIELLRSRENTISEKIEYLEHLRGRTVASLRFYEEVPLAGLEPARPCEQQILSLGCLPFHHSGILKPALLPLARAVRPIHRTTSSFGFEKSLNFRHSRQPVATSEALIFFDFPQPLPNPSRERLPGGTSDHGGHAPIFTAFLIACGDAFEAIEVS